MKKKLDNEGLIAEFVAPKLWEHPDTIDGGYTANDSTVRRYSIERSKKAIDIANILGTRNIVIWPAREGIYVNESKNHLESTRRIVHALNEMLEYDKDIKILGEMKPNEPMDHAYSPTTGHFMALGHGTIDPERVGILIESAHAILAGIDPAMEMAFAMSQNKLWSVHLNDQNGMKFDEDRIFGSINLKRAFDQVLVLYENDYGVNGEFIGLDVKALRTQKDNVSTRHLTGSMEIFHELLEVVKNLDMNKVEEFRVSRDYEELEIYIIRRLMGK